MLNPFNSMIWKLLLLKIQIELKYSVQFCTWDITLFFVDHFWALKVISWQHPHLNNFKLLQIYLSLILSQDLILIFFFILSTCLLDIVLVSSVSLRARHSRQFEQFSQDSFTHWFNHLEESFSSKEVQLKKFCSPAKNSCPLAENVLSHDWYCKKFYL